MNVRKKCLHCSEMTITSLEVDCHDKSLWESALNNAAKSVVATVFANIGQFVVVELWNQFWDLDEKHRVAHEIAYVAVEEYDYLTLKYVIAQDHDGDKDVTAMEGWNVREFSACGNNFPPPLPPP